MSYVKNEDVSTGVKANLTLIMNEQMDLAEIIDYDKVDSLISYIQEADRIFLTGAGRSGLALRFAAMRLMHFGLTVFVVGETTTPAIRKGDLLIAASGSGTTSSIVTAAEKSVKAGARVAAFSTVSNSPLANNASLLMLIPAAQKEDRRQAISAQYAGSLFEQTLVLLMDAVFQTMWQESGVAAQELWKLHANLE